MTDVAALCERQVEVPAHLKPEYVFMTMDQIKGLPRYRKGVQLGQYLKAWEDDQCVGVCYSLVTVYASTHWLSDGGWYHVSHMRWQDIRIIKANDIADELCELALGWLR